MSPAVVTNVIRILRRHEALRSGPGDTLQLDRESQADYELCVVGRGEFSVAEYGRVSTSSLPRAVFTKQ